MPFKPMPLVIPVHLKPWDPQPYLLLELLQILLQIVIMWVLHARHTPRLGIRTCGGRTWASGLVLFIFYVYYLLFWAGCVFHAPFVRTMHADLTHAAASSPVITSAWPQHNSTIRKRACTPPHSAFLNELSFLTFLCLPLLTLSSSEALSFYFEKI